MSLDMSTLDATVRRLHTAFDEFYKDEKTRVEDTSLLLCPPDDENYQRAQPDLAHVAWKPKENELHARTSEEQLLLGSRLETEWGCPCCPFFFIKPCKIYLNNCILPQIITEIKYVYVEESNRTASACYLPWCYCHCLTILLIHIDGLFFIILFVLN